jgi:Tfp pilus assembly protein FimT
MRDPGAYSLVELVFVLMLLGLLAGLGAPPLRQALAGARARAARDIVSREVTRARALAVARGGAALLLDTRRPSVWIEAPDTVTAPRWLDVGDRLSVSADGAAADTVRIRFDRAGLGVVANRTLRFRAGNALAGLTVSSYGRVRAW